MAYLPAAPTSIVTAQPKQYDIHNNFGMFPGERLLYHSKLKTGCCKLGDVHYTTVTDTRYAARIEEFICCGCCCDRPYTDTTIYLRDVSSLYEVRDGCTCCDICCYLTWCNNALCKGLCKQCSCLCCCCPTLPKRLQIHGTFPTHAVHIYGKDVPDFELMFTEAIAQHKLPNGS